MKKSTTYVSLLIAAVIVMRIGWYFIEQHREKERSLKAAPTAAPSNYNYHRPYKADTSFIINAGSN